MLPIKTFIHNGKYYVYDSNVNKLINVTRDVFVQIRMYNENKIDKNIINSNDQYESLKHLIKKGFFCKSIIDKIEHPWSDIYKDIIDNCMSFIILQTTRKCNFKCRYCHFTVDDAVTNEKTIAYMEWDIAKKAIDFLYEHSADSPRVCIGFYGGEPLLNFDIIKRSILYADTLFERHELSYSMTTNGSLLTKEVVDFIARHPFRLRISFDGPSEIQNKHRMFSYNGQKTFDIVIKNILYIKNTYPEFFSNYVKFNAVAMPNENSSNVLNFFESIGVSLNNVKINMANLEGIDYDPLLDDLQNMNFPKMSNMQYSQDNLTPQIRQALFDEIQINRVAHPNGACVPGHTRLFVSTDGDFYPCEKVPEYNQASKIGNIYKGYDYEAIYSMINTGKLTEDKCKSCWCIRFCRICASKCLSIDSNGYSCVRKEKACNYYKRSVVNQFKKYINELESK